MRIFLTALTFTALAFSQKPKDMCFPPPSSVAPALPAKLLTGQGEFNFPITTSNPEAQKFFNQGVAQMHSFWAREAERSFLQAAALDPEAAMPHWGVAMVAAGDYRPGFQLDQYREVAGYQPLSPEHRAIKAALKAQELSAKATDLEKLYIASIVVRRTGNTKNVDADYVSGLRALLAKYPKEVEARTFLALQIMGGYEMPSHKARPGTLEAVEILTQLMVEAPNHAGVHHYVIHGWEGASFAKEAWDSSKRYSEMVTNIPHALHMPGHIYSQTGKLNEALKSFSDAAVNERYWMGTDSLYGSGHHGHNIHYLATVATYKGEYDTAINAAKELLAIAETPREASALDNFQTAYKQGWFSMLRTLVEAERWDDILAGRLLPEINKPRQMAWRHWALGIAFAQRAQVKAAEHELQMMDAAVEDYTKRLKFKAPEELVAGRIELEAHILIAKGKISNGLKKFSVAASAQRALRYSEPPWYPRPVSIMQATVALKYRKFKEAKAAFAMALDEIPAWTRAEQGNKQVLAALAQPTEAP